MRRGREKESASEEGRQRVVESARFEMLSEGGDLRERKSCVQRNG